MICVSCKFDAHEVCNNIIRPLRELGNPLGTWCDPVSELGDPLGTWCDCQHRRGGRVVVTVPPSDDE